MTVAAQIFREYDIRGLVGSELDADTARDVGTAFAVFLDHAGVKGPIAVGRDNRPSGDALRDALVSALVASGVDVIDIGVVPTPTLYWALEKLGVAGGVQITASHNPAPYNGFKLCVGTNALYGDDIQKLLTIIEAKEKVTGHGSVSEQAVLDRYLDDIVQRIGPLPGKLRIALDCANGVGSLVGPALMARLGVDVTQCLLCTSDGRFPKRQPDPSQAQNLVDLQQAVRATSAHVGIALDGDADRIGVVDEHGEIVWGDRVLAIYARDVLAKAANVGKPIIFDVKCSEALSQAITAAGGKPFMWRTGHSLILAKMHELHAPLAGELSGHMYIADDYYGYDDALYSAARLLSIMARSGKTLTELLAGVPVYPSTPEIRVDCPDDVKFGIVSRAVQHWSADHTVVNVDGARVMFDGGWGLIRASNTQPALVLRFEAHTPDRLQAIQDEMESWLRQQGVAI
jgi:phosphomannomutase / phosphoglucomutase